MDVEIRKVVSRSDLKKFVGFPFLLYKGNKFWCPPLKFDEFNTLREDKNPAFEYCEAAYFIAYCNNRPVGRIAGIINLKEVERWQVKLVRFGWFDFIDDLRISGQLLEAVRAWGHSRGMTGMHGPLGFTDMDPEGMMMEGFDELSSLSAIYNFPYYPEHMVNLGFKKATDWVQFKIRVPDHIPEKVERMARMVLSKYDLRLLSPRKANDILPYAGKLFTMYNEAFRDLYGFTALTSKQIDTYTKQYFGFIRAEFVSIIVDGKDDVIGFGITMPSLAKALQKANGSLFPFGFYHLLHALRKNDMVHMYLVGIRPDYQGKGILALVYNELTRAYMNAGLKLAITHPQLEENLKAVSIWKNYDGKVHIRRRCWIKEF
ncbi:MAG: hypothetical protein WCI71_05575 [Bacteroidota bacterium]